MWTMNLPSASAPAGGHAMSYRSARERPAANTTHWPRRRNSRSAKSELPCEMSTSGRSAR